MDSDLIRQCGAHDKTVNPWGILVQIGKMRHFCEFPAGFYQIRRLPVLVHMGIQRCTIACGNAGTATRALRPGLHRNKTLKSLYCDFIESGFFGILISNKKGLWPSPVWRRAPAVFAFLNVLR